MTTAPPVATDPMLSEGRDTAVPGLLRPQGESGPRNPTLMSSRSLPPAPSTARSRRLSDFSSCPERSPASPADPPASSPGINPHSYREAV